MEASLDVTSTNWRNEVLKADLPVVVEFYTPTCPFCQRLTPIFKKLSGEFSGKMKFVMVNAAENSDIASGYGVMGVPTLKFFCSGRPIHEVVGFRSEDELRQEFSKVLETHKKCLSQSSPIYA